MLENTYYTDIYLRLSKEDGDKEESDSIANQRALILDFLKSMPDIRVHKIRIDDGYSGVDFNRPAFNEMLEDIKAGIVNCVIVKDFSRFGRNYIEAGKFIQVLFPRTGVRFIAVNDSYDSAKEQGYAGNIIVPFKNMVNDAYSADISTKVRSNLDLKRRNGAFVGAFAVYGYMKDPSNHNLLVVDEFAADVVNDIFNWKIDGLSALGIAERLNERGILSPMEYKRYLGSRYNTPFKKKTTAKWQAKAVSRILSNEIYIGILEQGKRITPNYKVRKRVDVPKEQWARVENTHESIIDREVFYMVQELLKQDTRAASKNLEVRPLSGIIFCADCKAAMVHKTNTKNGNRRSYYVCSAHRANKEICSTHVIRTEDCEDAVIEVLKNYIRAIIEIEEVLACVGNIAYSQGIVKKLSARLESKKEELRRNNEYRLSLHESYVDGIIRLVDFVNFKSKYDIKIQEAEAAIISIKEEIEAATGIEPHNHSWTNKFKYYENFDSITRKMVVELVKSVHVHENGRISVEFHYAAELERMREVA